MENPFESDEFRKLADHICNNVYQQMKSSAVSLHLHTNEVDEKLSIELGLAILCNKPIVAVVKPGMTMSQKLTKVVDKVITIEDDKNIKIIGEEVKNFLDSNIFSDDNEEEHYMLSPQSMGTLNFCLFALKIGAGVLFDKVIVLGKEDGIELPNKLSLVVDHSILHEDDILDTKKQIDHALKDRKGKRSYLFAEVNHESN